MLFIITPGADWAYAITSGVRHRSVFPAVSGLLLGHLVATAVVAGGLGALVARNPALVAVLTVIGALYLIWLGVEMARQPGDSHTEDEPVESSVVGQFGKGLGISLLNPKVLLLLGALLPQFVDPDGAWPIAVQMLTLGGMHVACCAVVYFAVALLARTAFRARPALGPGITRASGVTMTLIGGLLLVRQLLA
ncbi:LysE family translocator [Rhodococcus sp. IEGM 1408]|uniref:LysE family translocator n=1 Tax=Rhodococcus sp. IEGM 1408 TaxID=3082220 RepID=UPI0029555D4C|nr:LysE family translocator [Rhodococcus sp. IEGM 1408]MDV8002827.1 LysE family translocator [Rhodococcus sp. IEGM 1408]